MTDKTLYPLSGVVPIIHTPWTEDNRIDFPSLERLIEQSIRDGVSGCILPAVASEVAKLSDKERTELVEEVIRTVDGRIHVTAGISDPDVRRSQRLARHAVETGADGVLCQSPMDIIEDKERVKSFMHTLSEVDLPMLMIQDLHWNGYGMGLDTIRELWEEIETFRCLKLETTPAGYKMTQIIEATDGLMPIGTGWSLPQLIEALDRGTHFVTTTAINRPFVHILRHYRNGNRAEASALFVRTLPYLAWAHQHIDISIHFYKLYSHRRGLFTTPNARQPILPFDDYHRRVANELIDEIIELEDELDEEPCT